MTKNLLNLLDFEDKAKKCLPKSVYEFISNGSLDQITAKRNLTAYADISLLPRVLRDVTTCNTSTEISTMTLSMPVIASPMAFQKLMHHAGETALAQALQNQGLGNILSTMSSESLESVINSTGCTSWLQIYIFKDRELTKEIILRAQEAGYCGLVLTVDTPFMAKREADIHNKFHLPEGVYPANFETFKGLFTGEDNDSALRVFASKQFDRSITWDDIEWLKNLTKLPIFLKGITHTSDAKSALKLGVNGIIISNHGGRQLDGMPSTIELLPKIAASIENKCPLLIDGGIRRGSDILKAILLGADGVLVGRPLLWGLAQGGQKGAESVLKILHNELTEAMSLCGITDINHINSRHDHIFINHISTTHY